VLAVPLFYLPFFLSVQRGSFVPTTEISGASFGIRRASARKLIDRDSDHNHYSSSCPTAGSRSSHTVCAVCVTSGRKTEQYEAHAFKAAVTHYDSCRS